MAYHYLFLAALALSGAAQAQGTEPSNPFLRPSEAARASAAQAAADAVKAAEAAGIQTPKFSELMNPVKLRGTRVGVVNGRALYRDESDRYYLDSSAKELTDIDKARAEALERQAIVESTRDIGAPDAATATSPTGAPQPIFADKPGTQGAQRPARAPARPNSAQRK